MANIGFIGIGNMGLPMAINLIKAGHEVKVFDLVPEAVERAVKNGGKPAKSLTEVANNVDAVITMLPAGQHVRSVYLGEGGLIASVSEKTLLIESSTIDVESARSVHLAAAEGGYDMLDAPVSGGVGGAEGGTLTFMCGGPNTAFDRARNLLDVMGGTVVHAGPAGNGQVAKICNNMLLGASMIATCEAFVLAEKLGLDHQKLFDIASTASGQCWAMTNYCPVPGLVPTSPANRNYEAGFTAAMMLKDLRLAQNAAATAGAATPLGAAAASLYALFENDGNGPKDFSGIIEMIRGEN